MSDEKKVSVTLTLTAGQMRAITRFARSKGLSAQELLQDNMNQTGELWEEHYRREGEKAAAQRRRRIHN